MVKRNTKLLSETRSMKLSVTSMYLLIRRRNRSLITSLSVLLVHSLVSFCYFYWLLSHFYIYFYIISISIPIKGNSVSWEWTNSDLKFQDSLLRSLRKRTSIQNKSYTSSFHKIGVNISGDSKRWIWRESVCRKVDSIVTSPVSAKTPRPFSFNSTFM